MGWNTLLSDAIENESGQVALCYYQTTNPLITLENGTIGYKFQTRANICLAWVNREHAQSLLDMLGGCCGGKRRIIYVASQTDVDRWSGVA